MLISIIIPVYNVAPYIENCLKSVMGQTYTGNMECLLVDDCGNDDSIAIAEGIINEYKGPIRFQFLHHKQNQGLSAARNTGTDVATGDYVFYLDGDDEITVDCVEKLARPVINDQTIEMVIGNRRIKSEDILVSSRHQKRLNIQQEDIVSSEVVRFYYYNRRKFYLSAWNKLIRRDFLIQNQLYFREGLLHEDILWVYYVVKYLCHLYVIPDITYIYHKRPHSITTGIDVENRLRHKIMIYEDIANNLTDGDKEREAKFYLNKVCALCVKNPNNEDLRAISMKMMGAFGDGNLFDKALYSAVLFLSKFSIGRKLFLFANMIRGKLKGRYC